MIDEIQRKDRIAPKRERSGKKGMEQSISQKIEKEN